MGIFLSDKANTVKHIVQELGDSRFHAVDQRWARIGTREGTAKVESVTMLRKTQPVPKFKLLNELLKGVAIEEYDALMVVDDDIVLPRHFVDALIAAQRLCDFALCQPARTQTSWLSHGIVAQQKGILGRQTRFVEIGPVFLIRSDMFNVLLPFEEASPMGWGLDFVWPELVEKNGGRLGIVDAVPIDHSLRQPMAYYDWGEAREQQKAFLHGHPYLTEEQSFTELSVIALPPR